MTLFLYLLRQLLVAFAFALGGVAFLVLPSIAVQAVHKLGGVSLEAVARYIPMALVELVPYLLPMAFLLAVVSTFGRLATDRELIAINMAGFHPVRLLVPGLSLAVLLAGATHYLIADFAPKMKYQRRAYLAEMRDDVLELLAPGKTEIDHENFSLRGSYDEETQTFHRVLLSTVTEDGEEITVTATSAKLLLEPGFLKFRLHDAETVFGASRIGLERPTIRIPLEKPREFSRERAKYQSSGEIQARLAAGGLEDKQVREFRYEIESRRAISAIYLLFVLLGVPTGIALRSGTQLAALCVAVGYALVYYLIAIRLGKELSNVGTLPPVIAAWATNGLFAIGGGIASVRILGR
ncbi:MAG: LptF/LptG family permease [Planctomycetota bacterium]